MVVVVGWYTRGKGIIDETGLDANSTYVASKTGKIWREPPMILRGAVTGSGDPNGTQRDPKSGILGRENIEAKV